jgi:hypothetical protein
MASPQERRRALGIITAGTHLPFGHHMLVPEVNNLSSFNPFSPL